MGKPGLSFLIFILPILLNAQRDLADPKWAVSFTAAIIPLTGNGQLGIQPGIAYLPGKHFLLLTEVTFPTGTNNNSDPSFMDKEYLRIKPEIRFFFRGQMNLEIISVCNFLIQNEILHQIMDIITIIYPATV